MNRLPLYSHLTLYSFTHLINRTPLLRSSVKIVDFQWEIFALTGSFFTCIKFVWIFLSRQKCTEYSEFLLMFSVTSSGNYFPVNSYNSSLRDLLSSILWGIYRAAKIIRILKASSDWKIQQTEIRIGLKTNRNILPHTEYTKMRFAQQRSEAHGRWEFSLRQDQFFF